MISRLCYELYKLDWKRSHMITTEIEMDFLKDYYEGLADHEDTEYTYEDYLEEFGYNGELYVCFEEFLETEYLEDDYMTRLLNNVELSAMYYDDISKQVAGGSVVKSATFTSVWDGGYEVSSNCKVNMETHEVFDIEISSDGQGFIEMLDYEYITVDGKDYSVFDTSEYNDISPSDFWYNG